MKSLITAFLVCGVAGNPVLGEARWPQFLGPQGRGVPNEETKLPVHFGPTTNVAWKTALPPGHSSPCIWDNRIFLTALADGKLQTLCFDRHDGRELWRRIAPAEKIEEVRTISNPAASTPAIDGRSVYVYFGSYGLLCYDFDGNKRWSKPLPMPGVTWGTGTSPVVMGERVLLKVDQDHGSYMLAVDRATGATVWKTRRPRLGSGWSTPVIWRHDDVEEIVVFGTWRLTSYEPKDGAERWSIYGLPPQAVATPVTAGGILFLASYSAGGGNRVELPDFASIAEKHDTDGDGKLSRNEIPYDLVIHSKLDDVGGGQMTLPSAFSHIDGIGDREKDGHLSRTEWDQAAGEMAKMADVVLAVRPGGHGDITDTHVSWRVKQRMSKVSSPLYYRGRLYLVNNGGIASCLEAKTGRVVFQGRVGAEGSYYASPVANDGKVYAASERGTVVVFEAGDTLNVLARNDLTEPIMATPAIVDGKLYVRTESHLYAFRP